MDSNKHIESKLRSIRQEYDDMDALFKDIQSMTPLELKRNRQKVAFVIEASKIAEAIIVFVCTSSGIKPFMQNSSFEPDFSDYIRAAFDKKIISSEQRNYFDSIRRIRNKAAHRDETPKFNLLHDPLSINRVGVVHEELKYLIDWFFSVFLKNNYPELSLTEENINRTQTTYHRISSEKVSSEKSKSNEPPGYKTTKVKRKSLANWKRFLFFAGLLFVAYYFIYPVFGDKENYDKITAVPLEPAKNVILPILWTKKFIS